MEQNNKYKFSEFEQDFLSAMNDGALPQGLLKMLKPIKNFNVKQCLEVYRNAKKVTLSESLYENFSACARVVGDKDFFSICEDYLNKHTSKYYNLEDYGDDFPCFLEKQSICNDFPFLYDLAVFEWKFKEVFHAKYQEYDAQRELANVADFSQIKLSLQAGTALIKSDFRIKEIWDLRNSNEFEFDWEALLNPSLFFLYKVDDRIYIKDLQPMEYDLIALLLKGLSIGEVMENISEDYKSPDLKRVEHTFQFLISNRLISQINVAT